ncbi:Cobalt transport protein CbiN [uncultured Gammaproteobacteria bacterium]
MRLLARPKPVQTGRTNLMLLFAVVLIVILPMVWSMAPPEGEGRFKGADDLAMTAINTIAPDYVPWWQSLWKPPSGEIESMLFALQAALGAGMLGYYLGLRQGRGRLEQHLERQRHGVEAKRRKLEQANRGGLGTDGPG